MKVSAIAATALLLAGCATTSDKFGSNAAAERDPYEKFNRGVYGFNKGVDKALVRPAASVYRTVTPTAARRGITNVFNNVDEPFSFINALLQGKIGQAGRTFARFAVNTILGVGGLADHATDMGLVEEPEDIGQTLAVWGVNSGPFLMLPILGPSTLRDGFGTGLEFLGADPWRHVPKEIGLTRTERYGVTGLELVDTRSQLIESADALLRGSADEYATIRSAYLQSRLNDIYDGAPPEEAEEPFDEAADPAAATATPPAATAPETPPVGDAPKDPPAGAPAPLPNPTPAPEEPATTPGL